MYKLTRSFAWVAAVAVLIGTAAIGIFYRNAAEHDLITLGERQNVTLAQALANALQAHTDAHIAARATELDPEQRETLTTTFHAAIDPLIAGLPVLKVKVFNLAGLTLYSTDHQQIGELKESNYPGAVVGTTGQIVTALTHRDHFKSNAGELSNIYVISSYLPLRRSPGEPISGVFEIYTDITTHVARVHGTQYTLFGAAFAVLSLVYLVLLGFVYRSERVIRRRDAERASHMETIKTLNESMDERLRRATADLAGARDEAISANQTKSRFLASMSHELRTPLNAIIGYSEMLLEELDSMDPQEVRADLDKIRSSGKNLLTLINDILDLSKIEAGKVDIALEPVSPQDLATETLELVKPLAAARNNALQCDIALQCGPLLADRVRVRQVLLNLLSNAAKFTDSGTISVRVRPAQHAGKDVIEISVSDTGIGMTEEQLGRIFNEFAQAEAAIAAKYGGTGLGLVIVRRLCRLMGGDIDVSSQVGVGSTFRFWLPAAVTLRAAATANRVPREEPAATTSAHSA